MGVRHGPETGYIQERRRWEQRPTLIDASWIPAQVVDGQKRAGYMDGTFVEPLSIEEGGRGPYVYEEYPKMLYLAVSDLGGPRIDRTIVVNDEAEERLQRGQGFHCSQQDALDALAAQHVEFGKLAAERNHELLRMSEKARAEAQAFEEQHATHQPTMPEKSKRKLE